MKTVQKLNKKKHRRDIWVDTDGSLWFYDYDRQQWSTLSWLPPDAWYPASGWANDTTVQHGDETHGTIWPDGPFRRILKGERK